MTQDLNKTINTPKRFLYAVINFGHSSISGMVAYEYAGSIVPICIKSYPSSGIFWHGTLSDTTSFKKIFRSLINDFESEVKKQFNGDQVKLQKIYIGISPLSMDLKEITYTEKYDSPQKITKGVLSFLQRECMEQFQAFEAKKTENKVHILGSLTPVYFIDDDFENPKYAENIQDLNKSKVCIKQQVICVKEAYINTIKEQIDTILQGNDIEIQFLSNPLIEAKFWKERESQDYIYINMGAGSTSVFMTKDGIFHKMLIFPFGGDTITNDIKKYFSISEELAEKLKVKYAEFEAIDEYKTIETAFNQQDIEFDNKTYSVSNLNKLVYVRLKDILLNIQKFYIKKEYSKKQPNKVIFYGGGANLQGFEEFLKYIKFNYRDIEIKTDLSKKINKTMDNIHNINWEKETSQASLCTLLSLINYVDNPNKYHSLDYGYSFEVETVITSDETFSKFPINKRAKSSKINTTKAEPTTIIVQDDIFTETEKIGGKEEAQATTEPEVEEEIKPINTEKELAPKETPKESPKIEEVVKEEEKGEILSPEELLGGVF